MNWLAWFAVGCGLGVGYFVWMYQALARVDRPRTTRDSIMSMGARQATLAAVMIALWKLGHADMSSLLGGFLLSWSVGRLMWIVKTQRALKRTTGA